MPVSLEVANRALAAMSHMQYFPTEPEAVAILAGLIAEACPDERFADRLPGAMLFDKWPGSATLMHKIREMLGEPGECRLCRGHRFRIVLADGRLVPPGAGAIAAVTQPCSCIRCTECSDSGFVRDQVRGGVKRCHCRRASPTGPVREENRSTARTQARLEREEQHS